MVAAPHRSALPVVVWLDPFQEEVQNFTRSLVMEVTNRYDGDGIQFDDHMSLPRDFEYDKYILSLYKASTRRSNLGNLENSS